MSALVAGFTNPVEQSQQSFKALLMAQSYPGRVHTTDFTLDTPGDMAPSLYALALTLFDSDTPVWIAPSWRQASEDQLSPSLKFHCNCPMTEQSQTADMALVRAEDLDGGLADFHALFKLGSDEYPDQSATLFVQVPGLSEGLKTTWSGPGIKVPSSVSIAGLDQSFWDQRNLACSAFPLGLDMVFCAGNQLIALPRSTKVEIG